MKEETNSYQSQSSWVKRPELLGHLYRSGIDTNDRTMRAAIEELIVKDGVSIASSEKGYSLIISRLALDDAVAYLDAKAQAIAIRKNCLIRNFDGRHQNKQLSLL